MTSYLNACDVTVANSNHKQFVYFFGFPFVPPTLKNVPSPMFATVFKWKKNRTSAMSKRASMEFVWKIEDFFHYIHQIFRSTRYLSCSIFHTDFFLPFYIPFNTIICPAHFTHPCTLTKNSPKRLERLLITASSFRARGKKDLIGMSEIWWGTQGTCPPLVQVGGT